MPAGAGSISALGPFFQVPFLKFGQKTPPEYRQGLQFEDTGQKIYRENHGKFLSRAAYTGKNGGRKNESMYSVSGRKNSLPVPVEKSSFSCILQDPRKRDEKYTADRKSKERKELRQKACLRHAARLLPVKKQETFHLPDFLPIRTLNRCKIET